MSLGVDTVESMALSTINAFFNTSINSHNNLANIDCILFSIQYNTIIDNSN